MGGGWQLDLGDEDRTRRVLTILSLLTLFAILVGTTVVGIAENWPRHRTVSAGQQFTRPKTYGARVVELQAVLCQAPGAQLQHRDRPARWWA